MKEVFISYVHEDLRVVQFLKQVLELNGIRVWLDKTKLQPGTLWKPAIENAIRNGTYFLSVHSRARATRDRNYANEELVVAIEEFRRRPPAKSWLIPIQIDDCDIEDRPIGGGLNYSDIHRCDLRDWAAGLATLMGALGVDEPVLDTGRPLAPGLPSLVKVQHGLIRYERLEGLPEFLQGMEHTITGGWCKSTDDGIVAYFEVRAPIAALQTFNELLGYTGFHAFCTDEKISEDINRPSEFFYHRQLIAPAGAETWNFQTGDKVILPFDLPFTSIFVARGVIDGSRFFGSFDALVEMNLGDSLQKSSSRGRFEIVFGPDTPMP